MRPYRRCASGATRKMRARMPADHGGTHPTDPFGQGHRRSRDGDGPGRDTPGQVSPKPSHAWACIHIVGAPQKRHGRCGHGCPRTTAEPTPRTPAGGGAGDPRTPPSTRSTAGVTWWRDGVFNFATPVASGALADPHRLLSHGLGRTVPWASCGVRGSH